MSAPRDWAFLNLPIFKFHIIGIEQNFFFFFYSDGIKWFKAESDVAY